MASTAKNSDRPPFPTPALGFWLGAFAAAVALVTLWALPLSEAVQIAASVAFLLVPAMVVIFWLGRLVEYLRAEQRRD